MRFVTHARWSNLLVLIILLFSLGVTPAQAVQGPDDPGPIDPQSIPGLEDLSAFSVKRLGDGSVLVAGTVSSASGILARVLPNGRLDLTFGPNGSGLASFEITAGQEQVIEVDVDGDGNILVVVSAAGDQALTLARFTGNGTANPLPAAASGVRPSAIGAAADVELDVDTTADNQTLMACTNASGDCSLRGAIRKANLDTTVVYGLQLQPQIYTLTLADGDGDTDLDVRTSLEVYANGARVDAGGTSRAFDVSVATLYLENADLTNGNVKNSTTLANRRGGAIRGDSASILLLKNVSVISNQAEKGGGVFVDHQATLTNVTFEGNTATTGAGLEISGLATAELFHVSLLDGLNSNSGTLYMQNSVLADYPDGPGTAFCDGDIQTRGGNWIKHLDGCVIVGETGVDTIGQVAGLLNLQTSGRMRYAYPTTGSPMVDKVACLPSVTTDQLGKPRGVDGNGDGTSACDIGAIEYQTGAPNGAPTAVADSLTTRIDTPVNFTTANLLANDSDPDGDTLTIQSVSTTSTKGGTITKTGSGYRYTPATGFFGQDTFTYVVADALGNVANGTVNVMVAGETLYMPLISNP